MVRPLHFSKNDETAVNNYFQSDLNGVSKEEILARAQKEFDAFTDKLILSGVNVIVGEDKENTVTPDSIFPNNWITFHENGDVAMYPMFAENRRLERNEEVLDTLETYGFKINRVIDLSASEKEGMFLEGTGSMVLDRENALVYCALSPRSHGEVLLDFCDIFGYRPITFHAFQTVNGERLPIYHTNVVLTIGESFAILCADCIDDEIEREKVIKSLKRTEKEIIFITEDQLANFAGNMLQVIGNDEDRFLIMSKTANESLTEEQLSTLTKHTDILIVEIPTIEKIGGGSARCMMAEVFLPHDSDEVN